MNIHEAYKIIRYYRDKEARCQCDPACGMCLPCVGEHDGDEHDDMWAAADQWLKAYEG